MMERTGAVFGLDTRSPFNDRRLVDLALAFPDRLRWAGGPTKLVLRRAMGESLPAPVRERSDKAEFSAVFAEEYGGPGFAELFHHPRLERLGWTRRAAAGSHLEALRRSHRGLPGSSIWGAYFLVALEVWSSETVRR
jgi:asparagine synthase (glutamine-hydrolysing)